MCLKILILLCISINIAPIKGEVYSAVTDMEDVLEVEHLYIETMENYVKEQYEIIDFLKS